MQTLKIRADETPAVIFQKCVNAQAEWEHRNDPASYGIPTPIYQPEAFKRSTAYIPALISLLAELNP